MRKVYLLFFLFMSGLLLGVQGESNAGKTLFGSMMYAEKETYIRWTVITLLLIILLVMTFYYLWKRRLSNQLQRLTNTIVNKQKEINRLRSSSENNTQQLTKLKKELENIEKRHTRLLQKGLTLYEELIQGGNTLRWSKDDYIHFVQYYQLRNPEFVHHINNDYEDLSPRYKTFAILYDMGMNDEEVMRALVISESTVRSCKSRIKMKQNC